MINFNEMRDLIKKLEPYIELEGSECGEILSLMRDLSRYEDLLGDDFATALIIELKSQLQYWTTNFKIVEKTYTKSYETLTYKILEEI